MWINQTAIYQQHVETDTWLLHVFKCIFNLIFNVSKIWSKFVIYKLNISKSSKLSWFDPLNSWRIQYINFECVVLFPLFPRGITSLVSLYIKLQILNYVNDFLHHNRKQHTACIISHKYLILGFTLAWDLHVL